MPVCMTIKNDEKAGSPKHLAVTVVTVGPQLEERKQELAGQESVTLAVGSHQFITVDETDRGI